MADTNIDQVMRFFHDHPERPWHVQDIQRRLKLDDRGSLRTVLAELVDRGDLVRTRRRTYGLPQEMNLIVGKLQVASGGYGFVISDAGGKDLFIPADRLGGAWDTDRVIARPNPQKGDDDRPSGEIVRVVERGYQQVVGTLEYARGYAILRPDSVRLRERILLTPDSVGKLEGGSRIVVGMVWPEVSGEKEPFGEVLEFLGDSDDPEVETRAVIVKYGLKAEFDNDTMAEAKAVPENVTAEMMGGRTDYRKVNTMTVDGEDAKDFDDAISVERLDSARDGMLRVGIHIADVSYYVAEGTSLDEEAVERATSVYLPGRVLPMLPEELSNGICSLEEGQARLALSVFVDITRTGEVKGFKFKETVIQSDARLTYEQVQKFADGGRLPQGKRKLERDVKVLLNLTQELRKARIGGGALDFHFTEAKVDVDDEGTLHVTPIRSDVARQLIEELMLLANRLVAQELTRRDVPALFRIHEDPSAEKIAALQKALGKLGYTLDLEHTKPQDLQAILRQAAGKPEAQLVSTLLLRSLKQAKYSSEDLGHFGLAFPSYLHFTSPIRRYPDLVVHRVVRGMLQHRLSPTLKERMRTDFPRLAEHVSERERVAEDAERDLTRYFHARWAKDQVGTAYTGTIVGVTNFGVFLELPNGVEGLMHVSHLMDDYYLYLEDALMLMGKHTRKKYRLGDRVEVRILAANPTQRQIDLIPADMEMPEVEPEERVVDTRPPKVLKSPVQGVAEGVADDPRQTRKPAAAKGGKQAAQATQTGQNGKGGKASEATQQGKQATGTKGKQAAEAKQKQAAGARAKDAQAGRGAAKADQAKADKPKTGQGKAAKAKTDDRKADRGTAEKGRGSQSKSAQPQAQAREAEKAAPATPQRPDAALGAADKGAQDKAGRRKKRKVLKFG
ncbi:MAG: ribonuclease R [Trueperaceae bacterium]